MEFRLTVLLALLLLVQAPTIGWNAAAQAASESDGVDVRFQNPTEIFSPREPLTLEIRPRAGLLDKIPSEEKTIHLHVAVFRHSGPVHEASSGSWRRQEAPARTPVTGLDLQIPIHAENPWIPVSLLAPVEEGTYDIAISLSSKAERTGTSILGISSNPLQKKTPKIQAEKTVQCVVFDATPSPRPVGDPVLLRKELLDTVDSAQSGWRHRLMQIPALPKVANLTAPLTSARLPELPRLNVFRERPAKNSSSETEPATESEEQQATNDTTALPETAPTSLPRPLNALLEQWRANASGSSGSLGSGHLQEGIPVTEAVSESPTSSETTVNVLAVPESPGGETWVALPLLVREVGRPHLLELDYPSAHQQELEIDIVEMFDHQGQTVPVVTAGTGLHVTEEIVSDALPKTLATHRLLFWPKTKNPMLLLVNRQARYEARFGNARVYRISADPETTSESGEMKTRLPKPLPGATGRRVLGYLHGTEIPKWPAPENHSLSKPHRPTQWSSLPENVEHLVDMLHLGACDGIMLTVASKESLLFPCKQFFTESPSGETPAETKDLLELFYRLFDREQMSLIPAIDFDQRLRKVEEYLSEHPESADELYWDRSAGTPFRYNLLHPVVQDAMIDVVAEMVRRYAGHPSFGGLAVQLCPEGYAGVPITVQAVDDRTFTEFLGASAASRSITFPPELSTPGAGAARARFIQSDAAAWEAWVAWRAQKVCDFYARLAKVVAEARPEAKLYLAGGTMLDTPSLREYCTPTLLNWISLSYVLRIAGFDLSLLNEIPSLVFLRPSRVKPFEADVSYEQFNSAELAGRFARDGAVPGTLFFHESEGASTTTPAGYRNRRRFVRHLAQADVLEFFDGGKTLASGEDGFSYDFRAAYRRLPSVPFQTFVPESADKPSTPPAEKSIQPLTVRFLKQENGLIVYLLNDAPFPIEATLSFSPTRAGLEELSGRRTIAPLRFHDSLSAWQVALEPYDFLAVFLDDPHASLWDAHVRRPVKYCGATGELQRKVDQLNERIRDVQQGIGWDKLKNPDFEIVSETSEDIVGWTKSEGRFLSARIDPAARFSGRVSMKLEGQPGIAGEPGVLWSDCFEAPSTGRIFASVCFGIPENVNAIPLNIVLAGRHDGSDWHRSVAVQTQLMPTVAATPSVGGVRWHRMIASFDRLPQGTLEDLRLGFHVFGPGTVWVDDISLFQVSFTANEIKELQRLVLAARVRCNQERVSDLMTILEGHWAQFLFRHVPDRTEPVVHHALATAPPAVTDAGSKAYADNAVKAEAPKKENRGVLDRIKGFFGR